VHTPLQAEKEFEDLYPEDMEPSRSGFIKLKGDCQGDRDNSFTKCARIFFHKKAKTCVGFNPCSKIRKVLLFLSSVLFKKEVKQEGILILSSILFKKKVNLSSILFGVGCLGM
jgi:hypothetical protein